MTEPRRSTAAARRLAACAGLALALAGSGAAADRPADAKPVKRVLTAADAGRCFTMRVGRTVQLRVPVHADGAARATGGILRLAPVESFAPTGYREWEVRAVRVGRTVLSAPRRDGTRFRVTIRVTG